MIDILSEVDSIKQRSQKSLNELNGLYDFFKIFTKTYQEEVDNFEQRLYEHQEVYKNLNDSILSANLIGIYDCFNQSIKNTQTLMTKINNELISPLEFFHNNQFRIYQNNINELREVNKMYNEEKDMMEYLDKIIIKLLMWLKKKAKDEDLFSQKRKIIMILLSKIE